MNPELKGIHYKTLLLGVPAVILPFISWEKASWLEGAFAALVFLLFLLEVRRADTEKRYLFPSVPLLAPFLLLVLLSLYHLIRSPVPYASALFLVHILTSLMWYYLLLLKGKELPLLSIVSTWVAVLLPWMLIQKFSGGDPTPSGPFTNPNYLATVLLSCIGYTAGSLIHPGGNVKRRVGLFLLSAACAGGLLLTGSRSAMLGMILLLLVIMIMGKRKMRWAALAVIVAALILPTTVRYRVLEGYKKDPHAFTRVKIWEAALRMGMDHPVLGVGPNLFYSYSPLYAFPMENLPVKYGRIARKPHNEYLRSWAEGGLAGVIAAFSFVFLTLILMVRAWKEGRAGPVLGAAAVLFQAFFHDVTEVFAPMVLGVYWLSALTPESVKTVSTREGRSRRISIICAVVFLIPVLWMNLNSISGSLWQKGRMLMQLNPLSATGSLETALAFNPLHPGAARDLARVRLGLFAQSRTSEDRDAAREAILRAKALNRLDTVPPRLEAALYRELAADKREDGPELLIQALSVLEQALQLEPFNVLILLQMADINRELGSLEKALSLVENAIVIEPNYLEAHRIRIKYLSVMDPSRVPDARHDLEAAVKRVSGRRALSTYEEIILR